MLKSKKTTSKSKYPEVDNAVYEWFGIVQHPYGKCKPLPLSRAVIQARAKRVAQSLNLVDFKASNGAGCGEMKLGRVYFFTEELLI